MEKCRRRFRPVETAGVLLVSNLLRRDCFYIFFTSAFHPESYAPDYLLRLPLTEIQLTTSTSTWQNLNFTSSMDYKTRIPALQE